MQVAGGAGLGLRSSELYLKYICSKKNVKEGALLHSGDGSPTGAGSD